ncbi:hypothetical protein [Streptomyces sp. NPDC058045]|uniref:hypothetical protein n=1 Tax=Streptomyces sp. NPDC058045 TaxID=3346311 RepID=UPI0036E443E1
MASGSLMTVGTASATPSGTSRPGASPAASGQGLPPKGSAFANDVSVKGGCLPTGHVCGGVINSSDHKIWAIKDFDSNGPKPGTEWRELAPGERTPDRQDWDGVYVECDAEGTRWSWVPPGFWWGWDWELPAGYWQKVRTIEDLEVESQSC